MRTIILAVPAFVSLALAASPALSQETRYIDDRSSAASLIESFYNAVNRKEFVRAWDYYGDQKPAVDFETFAKGYENTQQVNVITGNVASEGAAGSTIYYLPVSIIAFNENGGDEVFSGCYTLRLANPAIQEPPFHALHIEKASLKRSDVSYEEALPTSCPDAPAPDETDSILSQAKTLFYAANPECDRNLPGADPAVSEVEQYRIPFRYSSDLDDQPEREARLFRFYCSTGAYNETHVYYQYDDEGLRQLYFATPDLDIRYENDDTDSEVKSITTIGYQSVEKLVNSFYDEASQSITSHGKWRGVGDASDSGTWIFRNGRFSLVHFEVDASYDGEINPEAVLDFHTAP